MTPIEREVCGSYHGAAPWTIWTDEDPSMLAARLADSAHCRYYTVDGVTYGPFDGPPREGRDGAVALS